MAPRAAHFGWRGPDGGGLSGLSLSFRGLRRIAARVIIMLVDDSVDLSEARRVAALAGSAYWGALQDPDGTWRVEVGSERRVVARGLTREDAYFWAGAASMFAEMCADLERSRAQRDAAMQLLNPDERERIEQLLRPPAVDPALDSQLADFLSRYGVQTEDDRSDGE